MSHYRVNCDAYRERYEPLRPKFSIERSHTILGRLDPKIGNGKSQEHEEYCWVFQFQIQELSIHLKPNPHMCEEGKSQKAKEFMTSQ